MKILLTASLIISALFGVSAQVPLDVHVTILKAEDSRSFDEPLAELLKHKDADIRRRAALAAGRIGVEKAVPALTEMLMKDDSLDVRVMGVFALGEIESAEAAEAVVRTAIDPKAAPEIRARAVEAAGKIVAANAEDPRTSVLKESIVRILNTQSKDRAIQNTSVIRAGLTAVHRARPDGGEDAVIPFLAHSSPEVVADALNTLARLRSKAANPETRELLKSNKDPIVRANAARLLGAAEDKDSVDMLIIAAAKDADSRVRVSAIRSLAQLKDQESAATLIARGNTLLAEYKRSKFASPIEKNELLEIATALGRLKQNTDDPSSITFLSAFAEADRYRSPETEIAFARIAPKLYIESLPPFNKSHIRNSTNSWLHGIREIATLADTPENSGLKKSAIGRLRDGPLRMGKLAPSSESTAVSEALRSLAAFKPDALEVWLNEYLQHRDVFIRTTAADLTGEQPPTVKSLEALDKAFTYAVFNDMEYNDAQLSVLNALYKLDKKAAIPGVEQAAGSLDHVVRLRVDQMLADPRFTHAQASPILKVIDRGRLREVRPHFGKGTKLGQILNTEADYRRAATRRNGTVKAILTTEKGTFTIDLLPEDAPLTVDNFIKLANAKYFDGLEVHRVVPNFVMQDGDPIGNGSGGPGWSIRCEINMVSYDHGAVGMALSGKDTGGSQWFVTHSPQPHLDGGYTVFGRVNETDMMVVDSIVRGDKIVTVKVIEGGR